MSRIGRENLVFRSPLSGLIERGVKFRIIYLFFVISALVYKAIRSYRYLVRLSIVISKLWRLWRLLSSIRATPS